MNDHTRRPRKLVWVTLALAAATAGLALRWVSPALSPASVTHVPVWFDIAFGVIGGGGLAWLAVRLWRRHRRDSAAVVFAFMGWMLLVAGVALRSALFAQADYERGRWAFFVAAAVLGAIAAIMWWRSKKRFPTENTEHTERTESFKTRASSQ